MRCVGPCREAVCTWLNTRKHSTGRNAHAWGGWKSVHLTTSLCQQHRRHAGEKHCQSSTDRALFAKSCKFQASGKSFTFKEVGKDFLGSSGRLQQQAPHTREKPNSRGECAVAFHTVKSHCLDSMRAWSPKHTLAQHQGVVSPHLVRTRGKCYRCGKNTVSSGSI